MTRVQLLRSVTIVAYLVVGVQSFADIGDAPGEEALFRRILAESDAYDQKWLRSYSAQFAARQVFRNASGEVKSDYAHEGSVVVDGRLVAAFGAHGEQDGPTLLKHQVADGELVVRSLQAVSTTGQKAPPQVSMEPGHGFGGDGDFPMLWISVGNYLRIQFPHGPLEELLAGEVVQGPSTVMDGAPVSYTQRLTGLSACKVTVDNARMVELSLTMDVVAGPMSFSVAVECLVDPAKAYRLRRTQLTTTTAEASVPYADTITLSQDPRGVWYPSHVHGEYHGAWKMGLEDAPVSEGVLEKTRDFTEFTTRPDIPAGAFAAIPPEGSAARREALRSGPATLSR